MATLAKLLVELGVDGEGLTEGLDKAVAKTTSVADGINIAIGGVVVDAAQQGAQAIAGFVGSSLSAAGDFEKGMLDFSSVTGTAITDAGFSLADFEKKFLDLGASTAFSAAQAQEAAIALAKGGVPIPDIMEKATQATLDLASAGGLELGAAADIVAKQLGVWADQGVDAAQVSDLLAQAANASTVDVDELANGLANVQGTAETVGVEYKDLVSTMALLAPNFASASTAGTSLNNFLIRLQPTTANATEAMQELGLVTADGNNVFFDANGNFLGMANAAEHLKVATAGLSEQEKTLALQTIFGNDAMGAAVALAAQGTEGFDNVAAAMQGAGSAADQAAIKQQGLNFATDSLFGSIETLQIIVGSALLPVLTQLINDALIPAVNVVTDFVSRITTASDPIAALTAEADRLIPGLGAFIPVALEIGKVIKDNLQPILIGVAGVLGVLVVSAIASMVAAALTVAAPFIAAAAIAVMLYKAYDENFMGIKDAVDTALTVVKNIVNQVISWLQAFWTKNGNEIMATAQRVWKEVVAAVTLAVQLITTVLNVVANFISANQAEIEMIIMGAWRAITGIIDGALNVIQGVIKTVLGLITGDWTKAEEGIKQIASGLMTALNGIFQGGLDVVKGVFNTGLEAIGDVISHFVGDAEGMGKDLIDGIVDGIKDNVSKVVNALKGVIDKAIKDALAALGIKSPSKVTAKLIGAPISQGIAVGILSAISDIEQAGTRAALAALQPVQPSVSASVGGTQASPYGLAGSALSGQQGSPQQVFNLDVTYEEKQSEASLRDDIRLLQMIYG